MSFIYRDRKDDDFDYGSTFCPHRETCTTRSCFSCQVVRSENRKKDSQLENFFTQVVYE